MKIIIREDKRNKLAKQILTDEFSGMYEDVNYITDGVGEQKTIHYRNGDGVIMIYGDRSNALYICDDVTQPLKIFSYKSLQLKKVIGEWFSEFFELPVKFVYQVNKSILN
jgi:hypothetical protein